MLVKDVYDDRGEFLKSVMGPDDPMSELVKEAMFAPELDHPDYAVFVDGADGRVGKFPLCDPGNAIVSAAYFKKFGDGLSPAKYKTAAENISNALVDYGISEEKDKLAWVSSRTNFSSDAAWRAVNVPIGSGKSDIELEDLFGYEGDVLERAETTIRSHNPYGRRQIVFKYKEAGVDLGDSRYNDYVRDEVGNCLREAVASRASIVGSGAFDELDKLASADSVDEAEALLTEYDEKYKLARFYDGKLDDPVLAVRKTKKVKAASEVPDVPREVIADTFGDSFADQYFSDVTTVFKSLPDEVQDQIRGLV